MPIIPDYLQSSDSQQNVRFLTIFESECFSSNFKTIKQSSSRYLCHKYIRDTLLHFAREILESTKTVLAFLKDALPPASGSHLRRCESLFRPFSATVRDARRTTERKRKRERKRRVTENERFAACLQDILHVVPG